MLEKSKIDGMMKLIAFYEKGEKNIIVDAIVNKSTAVLYAEYKEMFPDSYEKQTKDIVIQLQDMSKESIAANFNYLVGVVQEGYEYPNSILEQCYGYCFAQYSNAGLDKLPKKTSIKRMCQKYFEIKYPEFLDYVDLDFVLKQMLVRDSNG